MTQFIELSINGVVAGSLYALIAVAFVVVYKASRVINFALGELVMIGSALVAVGLHVFEIGLPFSIIFACAGSIPVCGIIFCCPYMLAPIRSGSNRTGKSRPGIVNSVAGTDRSLIQPKNGAWRRSIELRSA